MVTALSIVIGTNLVATVSHLDKSIRANKEQKENENEKRNIKDAQFYLNYFYPYCNTYCDIAH